MELIDNIKIFHLPFHSSDHRPILASLSFIVKRSFGNPVVSLLMFEEGWTKFEETKQIISKEWYEFQGHGTKDFKNKIEGCLKSLKSWNRERLNGSLAKAIDRKKRELASLSKDDSCYDSISKAQRDLDDLLEEEERYWKQRSRED